MSELTSQTQKNIDAISRLYPAIMAGDTDTVRAILAPDVVFHEPEGLPYGGTYHGPDGFLGMLQTLGEYWTGMEARDLRVAGTGDLVTAHVRFIVVSKATGLTLDTPLIEAWNMENGRAKEGRVYYYDTHAARKALGVE